MLKYQRKNNYIDLSLMYIVIKNYDIKIYNVTHVKH